MTSEKILKGLKITLIVFLSLFFVFSAIINIMCVGIRRFGKERTVSITTELGLQEVEGVVKPIFELSYWPNAFEIKINYLFDENVDRYYYQAVQFDSGTNTENMFGSTTATTDMSGFWSSLAHMKITSEHVTYAYVRDSVSVNEYISDDDWITSAVSTNKINDSSMIKVKSGEEIFSIEMKGRVYSTTETGRTGPYKVVEDYYMLYDWDYFYSLLYNSIKNIKGGTSQYLTLEFGDIFTIKQYKGNGIYETIGPNSTFSNFYTKDSKTYITFKINTFSEPLNSSADSSIGWYKNSQTYNVGADENGYFMGRDIINVSLKDFNLLLNSDLNSVTLKLSDDFINYYSKYSDKIYLDILIAQDEITSAGYTLAGISNEELSKFGVKSCKLQYRENGELKVVDYEF